MIIIPWEERLEELYSIAEASGGDINSVEEEWFIFAHNRHGKFADIYLEPIPEKLYEELVEFCDTDYS